MKSLIIRTPKVAIAKLFLITMLSYGCGTRNLNSYQFEEKLAYDLIDHIGYAEGVLNRHTLSFEDLSSKSHGWIFNFEEIDQRNYNINWVTEDKPFVDLDTIFSPEQKRAINEKFQSLQNEKLKPRHLNQPKILTNSRRVVITFPIIQQGKTGEYFGFVAQYTSPESTLFIFKRTSSGWVEVAKVALGIS